MQVHYRKCRKYIEAGTFCPSTRASQLPTCLQTTLGELAFPVELTFGNSHASLFPLQTFQNKVESILYVQMVEKFIF